MRGCENGQKELSMPWLYSCRLMKGLHINQRLKTTYDSNYVLTLLEGNNYTHFYRALFRMKARKYSN